MTVDRENGRIPPHNLDAEESLLGAMLLSRDAIEAAEPIVAASDFYKPGHGHVFATIVDLWSEGDKVDPVTVAETLNRAGLLDAIGGPAELLSLQGGTPATSNAARYARIIAEHATLRRLIGVAGEIAELGYSLPADVGEAVDHAQALVGAVDLPIAKVPDDLLPLYDLLNRPDESRTPWVIPGLFRADWRVVVVAPEGKGKTLVLQQVGMCAAQGIHPFAFTDIEPVRVLFIDAENPEDRIVEGARLIDKHLHRHGPDSGDRVWIWNRPGGIDLRTRTDRSTLDAVLAHVRPQLVCMGPAYKLSTRHQGEGWDEAALAVQRTLDQARARYGFALLMEDHAPQSVGGTRDLRPMGSSLWLRWPEIGLKLKPTNDEQPAPLALGRWRGDRLRNSWPDRLDPGGLFPWEGYWKKSEAA